MLASEVDFFFSMDLFIISFWIMMLIANANLEKLLKLLYEESVSILTSVYCFNKAKIKS